MTEPGGESTGAIPRSTVRPGRLSARALIASVVDTGSYLSWDRPPNRTGVSPGYASQLQAAQEKCGEDEAVVTGEARVRGRRVALVAGEFGFLAGSIGVAASRRLIAAIDRATTEGLPLLASPTSGGIRMQEGTLAFVEMAKISAAIARHRDASLPYLVYLRHPTTGGTMASWGSLGHVTVAEPGALLGFLGPRVFEALYGEEFPPGVQTSENLFAHGLIDGVVSPEEVPEIVERTLAVVAAPKPDVVPDPLPTDPPERFPDIDAWESICRSRRPERPGVRDLLRLAASEVIPLNGTGQGEADPGLLLALVRFDGASCVLLGQDRSTQTELAPLGPGGLRAARRGMRLAQELRLPLVTVIDTPGAALSVEAEDGGLAGEIARCLADLVTLDSPTLTLLLGQGCGGGALALLPADRVVAAQHAWLSPLPPEGASAIIHRTTDRAPEMARQQGVRSIDLLAGGVVDRVVIERPDAADEPEAFCRRLGAVLRYELGELGALTPETLRERRRHRYASPLD